MDTIKENLECIYFHHAHNNMENLHESANFRNLITNVMAFKLNPSGLLSRNDRQNIHDHHIRNHLLKEIRLVIVIATEMSLSCYKLVDTQRN